MHLGLVLLLLVGHQVDLDVGVGRAPHVHGGQLGGLNDAHYELAPETGDKGDCVSTGTTLRQPAPDLSISPPPLCYSVYIGPPLVE